MRDDSVKAAKDISDTLELGEIERLMGLILSQNLTEVLRGEIHKMAK